MCGCGWVTTFNASSRLVDLPAVNSAAPVRLNGNHFLLARGTLTFVQIRSISLSSDERVAVASHRAATNVRLYCTLLVARDAADGDGTPVVARGVRDRTSSLAAGLMLGD